MKIAQELGVNHFASKQQEASVNVLFTASWIHTRINRYLKQFQLTEEQFNVLRILKGSLPNLLCAKDIALRMIDRGSNVTRIIDKLVVKNLVEKKQSEEDRREVQLAISSEGLKLLNKIDDVAINKEINRLSDIEAELLSVLLDKLRNE